MNAYITDQLARERADRWLADAAQARRVRAARKGRRARRGSWATDAADQSTGRPGRSPRPRRVAVAHLVTRPFASFQTWLAAGYL